MIKSKNSMGRTRRKRKKRTLKKLNDWSNFITLQKSMKMKYKDFKIGVFENTGRGMRCKKNLHKGDVLIALPFCHLIIPESPSKIFSLISHELDNPQLALSVLLIYESHLGTDSLYYNYIQTLPKSFTNLFFCERHEVEYLPEFMKRLLVEQEENIFLMYRKFINFISYKICPHCDDPLEKLYNYDRFTWAWFTVNTRSVYYEDKLKRKKSLALAPLLDMFNHSDDADTEINIDFENNLYIIKTLCTFKKYQQVFIKYGNHSNLKLLLEYGFIVPQNSNDFIPFTYGEILDCAREINFNYGNMTELKYKFISQNKLNENLTVNEENFSWNFYGLLYILITEDTNTSVIQSKAYSNKFNENEIIEMEKIIGVLAERKLRKFAADYRKMDIIGKSTESFTLAKKLINIYIKILQSILH